MFENLRLRRRAALETKALARATRVLDDHLLKDVGLGHLRRDRRGTHPIGLPGMWM